MAPELFNQSRHSFQTDMFSLGVVLWEIASQHLPFENRNWRPRELIIHVLNGTRENFPKETPQPYQALAQQCWDDNPQKRPTATEAAQAITQLLKERRVIINEGQEEVSEVSSASIQEPSYLTGTQDPSTDAETVQKLGYLEQTKFGI